MENSRLNRNLRIICSMHQLSTYETFQWYTLQIEQKTIIWLFYGLV